MASGELACHYSSFIKKIKAFRIAHTLNPHQSALPTYLPLLVIGKVMEACLLFE
jgi:hypothetical protein